MSNPQLNKRQLEKAWRLLDEVRAKLKKLSKGDGNLLFAYRRKIFKELMHDERGKPMQRRKLQELMWVKQKGKCAMCKKSLKLKGAELDRKSAPRGYAENNVRLVHHICHRKDQSKKGFH